MIWKSLFSFHSNSKNVPTFLEFGLYSPIFTEPAFFSDFRCSLLVHAISVLFFAHWLRTLTAFLYTRWWGERLGQRKRLHHRARSGPYGAADAGSRQKRPSATSRRGGPSADAFSAVTIRCNSPHMAAAAVEIMAVGGTQPHGHLKQTQHRSRC